MESPMLAGLPPFWLDLLGMLLLAMLLGSLSIVARRWWSGEPLIALRRRRYVPWGYEGAFLAALILFGASLRWLNGNQASEEALVSLRAARQMAFTLGALCYGLIAWLRYRYQATWQDFGAPRSWDEARHDAVVGVVACFAMLLPVYAVQSLLLFVAGLPSSHPMIHQLVNNPTVETVVAAGLMAVVIAPLFEELVFRVLLQGWLERLGGRHAWWPIFVSATLFALAHAGQGWAPVPLAVLAVGMGYVYRQTHRLVPVVAMHMAFNTLGLVAALASGGQGDLVPAPAP